MMIVLRYIADFFAGLWLWNMTWDWYHVPINFILLSLLFNLFANMTLPRAAIISFFSHLYAYLIFSILLVIMTYIFNYSYNHQDIVFVASPSHACFYLGLMYAFLQITFLCIVNIKYPLQLFKASVMALISNCLTAGIAYWLLPMP